MWNVVGQTENDSNIHPFHYPQKSRQLQKFMQKHDCISTILLLNLRPKYKCIYIDIPTQEKVGNYKNLCKLK